MCELICIYSSILNTVLLLFKIATLYKWCCLKNKTFPLQIHIFPIQYADYAAPKAGGRVLITDLFEEISFVCLLIFFIVQSTNVICIGSETRKWSSFVDEKLKK